MNALKIVKLNVPTIIIVVVMSVFAIAARHIVRADAAFSHAYLVYAALADDADTAAYVPTATNNPLRQELNATLNSVLGNTITPAERLRRAQRGLDLLQNSATQIDAIGPKTDAVDVAISAMEKSLVPGDAIFQKGDPQKIIASAKERNTATKDIRALSYRADFETGKIFRHLVDARGELTSQYVSELNNEIPVEEAQFNKRQNRYNDLQVSLNEIQAAYSDFMSAKASVDRP